MTPNDTTSAPELLDCAPVFVKPALNGDEHSQVGVNGDSYGVNQAPTGAFLSPPNTERFSDTFAVLEEARDQESRATDSAVGLNRAPTVSNPASYRIHLIVKKMDIGFESLYQEFSRLTDDAARTRHVKRILFGSIQGDQQGLQPSASFSNVQASKSFKITFRLSARDTGLEKLYSELSELGTVAERNHHVKRCLFNQLNARTKQSLPDALTTQARVDETPPLVALTAGASVSPWSNDSLSAAMPLTEEQAASKRLSKRKATITVL